MYVGEPDRDWLERVDELGAELRVVSERYDKSVLEGSGVTAMLTGGHFPGSLLL